MKKIRILLLGIFVTLFSVISSNAQTVQEKYDGYTCKGWSCEDGSGYACGDVQFHLIEHYNHDGYLEWFDYHIKGKNLVSPDTGEKFKFSYKHFENNWIPGETFDYYLHYTLFGNRGTRTIISEKWRVDTVTGEFTLIHQMYRCL